ncbi:hypothetical protein Desaci_4785 (plasmid) [Desulfosporosinus acidiphilus SJ4]|uniref:Uncharacterized protein n=1 Tax=Desulfosporosinus acidiphilus (strain DSM 22704 / JCM 16185 / SJ4) TaxID=646529 RepID=I4DCT5_DESAJ|nr:hypothetical protein [Desulfosporosinus acidiphilus]AFM43609.1 hypothetical protein Desaci_4785 [Desulfosporosinus acidiphilus SJ4]
MKKAQFRKRFGRLLSEVSLYVAAFVAGYLLSTPCLALADGASDIVNYGNQLGSKLLTIATPVGGAAWIAASIWHSHADEVEAQETAKKWQKRALKGTVSAFLGGSIISIFTSPLGH